MYALLKSLVIVSSFSGTLSHFSSTEDSAARMIQKNFRIQRAKLRLRAKERKFLDNAKVQILLEKLKKKDSALLSHDFREVSNDEFLFVYRRFLTMKGPKGYPLLDPQRQAILKKQIVKRFELFEDSYKYNNFTPNAIKKLVEFKKITDETLEQGNLHFLFFNNEKLPDLSKGTGRHVFLKDLNCEEDHVDHVTVIYVDYDTKEVFYSDSINVPEEESKALMESFGHEFAITYSTFKIQKDYKNCMIFAMQAAAKFLSSGDSFFERLHSFERLEEPRKLFESTS